MLRFDDTICPVDFQTHGQLDSDTVSHNLMLIPS
jgi:hypothetical protein